MSEKDSKQERDKPVQIGKLQFETREDLESFVYQIGQFYEPK